MPKNRKLIAVSGGVDSMVLLNNYKDEDIIVAFVNYNKRKDSIVDQQIAIDYCNKNKITIEILWLSEEHQGNFQEWARNKRYDFFKIIYAKHKCQELLIAQHKDDFLETAIMQWRAKRNPYYFGISKNSQIFGMNVSRPMIFKYWKSEIYEIAFELNITFNEDTTNFTDLYQRNIIRNSLNNKPIIVKEMIFNVFQKINVLKSIQNIKIISKYYEWSNLTYNVEFLRNNRNYSQDLIFKFLIHNFKDINISKNIIKSIEIFLLSPQNETKKFILSDNQKIGKLNNNVIIK
ncbi:MAG: tRNA lysidine(34) synthetase TilS [Mycoplasmataceae bacterium]|nr:tRNA lysidine(34) synthetase TilS [Mycoplasmataceae bacterium]